MSSKDKLPRYPTVYALVSTAPYDGPIEGTNEVDLAEAVERIAPVLNASWEERRPELEAQIEAARLRVRNSGLPTYVLQEFTEG